MPRLSQWPGFDSRGASTLAASGHVANRISDGALIRRREPIENLKPGDVYYDLSDSPHLMISSPVIVEDEQLAWFELTDGHVIEMCVYKTSLFWVSVVEYEKASHD